MRVHPAGFVLLTVVMCLASQARAACKKDLYFQDGAICSANRDVVSELVQDPTFQAAFLSQSATGYATPEVTPCSRALRCPISGCAITVVLSDGNEKSCDELSRILTERKLLTQAYVPLCSLSIDGKPFGKLYEPLDRTRHFKLNTIVSASGKPDEVQQVDLALTGKNAIQRVALPAGANRCVPSQTHWECSGFSDQLSCTQTGEQGIRFGNGPPIINFDKKGDFRACADLAPSLAQMPSLLSVAACLVPPPKAISRAAVQKVEQAQKAGGCPGSWPEPFLNAMNQCVSNYPGGVSEGFDKCCDIIRKKAQEKNGGGLKILGYEFFKGTAPGSNETKGANKSD